MKKTFLFVFLVSSALLNAQNMTNELLVKKSVQYHDPNDEWQTFKGQFIIKSEKEPVELTLDNALGIAHWSEVLKNGDTLTGGFVHKDTCIVRRNGKDIPPKGELENFFLDCKSIIERTNYWIYMYGLPMKLDDNQVNFVGNPQLTTFQEEKLWVLKVNYNLTQSEEYWKFYFDPRTFALRIAQFFHPALHPDSEYIIYHEIEKINGIVIPTKHSWYLFNKKEFIGSEKLIKKQ
ncbi:DUF6503 family protein [Ulvibacterium sp.]|uniref:DUF6503 family protein n=1 Tax=Ulvibacterium sp. TaxID=2665914 RepID=UPI003BAB59DE